MSATTTVGGGPNHCRTCRCLDGTDSLTVYPPQGEPRQCPTCGAIKWRTEIHTNHRGAGHRSEHCNCCTHPHDLAPGGYTIPTRGKADPS